MDETGVANVAAANILVQIDGRYFLIGGLSRIAIEGVRRDPLGRLVGAPSLPPIIVRSLASAASEIELLETRRPGDPIQDFRILKPTKLDLDPQGRPIPGLERISEMVFKECSLEHTQRFSFDPNLDPNTTYGELVVNCPPFGGTSDLQPQLRTIPPEDPAPKDAGIIVSAFDVTVDSPTGGVLSFRARMVEGGQIIATGDPRRIELRVQPVVMREIGTNKISGTLIKLFDEAKFLREMRIMLVVGQKTVPGPTYLETYISKLTLFNPARGANDLGVLSVDASFEIACRPDTEPACVK